MGIFEESQRSALYVHLRTFESDYDKSQSQMRAISSAWTTAVLAAVALVITTAATPIAVGRSGWLVPSDVIGARGEILGILRSIMCAIGSAGVLAFWYIDQAVYQRLLHSVFAYGMYAEFRDPVLPQIRSSMYLANLDITNRMGLFYRAQFWIFAILSCAICVLGTALAWIAGQSGTSYQGPSAMVWGLAIVHFCTVLFWEVRTYHRWPSLDETIVDFYPDMARELPQRPSLKGWYGQVLAWLGRRLGQSVPPAPHSRFATSSDARLIGLLTRVRHE